MAVEMRWSLLFLFVEHLSHLAFSHSLVTCIFTSWNERRHCGQDCLLLICTCMSIVHGMVREVVSAADNCKLLLSMRRWQTPIRFCLTQKKGFFIVLLSITNGVRASELCHKFICFIASLSHFIVHGTCSPIRLHIPEMLSDSKTRQFKHHRVQFRDA